MDRTEQQAAGTHPAPCARHCEANAFQIEIRGLKAAHASAVEAGKALAKQAFKAEQERDALAAGQKQMGEDLIVIQRIHSEQKARLYGEIAMLKADIKAAQEQKPVARIDDDESFQGPCRHAMAFVPMHRGSPLYAHPVPARELTDAVDDLAQHIRKIDGNHSMGAGALAESVAEWADRHLRGDAP